MLESINYPFAYFDCVDFYGECTFEIEEKNDNLEVNVCTIAAYHFAGETEFEYILTDKELETLEAEIRHEVIASGLFEYLEQIELDYQQNLEYDERRIRERE